MTRKRTYSYFAIFATLSSLVVIVLGAYTRLKDAGLGCPDWPGCYGHFKVPATQSALQKAADLFPGHVVEAAKAWPEMIHRYFAGGLGILILILALWAVARRIKDSDQPIFTPWLLVVLVIFQAMLGMWTVTLQLLPLVVMGHLLGGMTIAALLWWLGLSSGPILTIAESSMRHRLKPFAILGLLIVFGQIFLGGWTSANYAALPCTNFPFCHGSLFPTMDFANAFNFISPIGANYEGGVLDSTARITIQMVHRYGAFITAAYIGGLAMCLIFSSGAAKLRSLGWILFAVLCTQFLLGVLNIKTLLSLPVAVAHNGIAAILLLTMVTLIYKLYGKAHANR